jgi:tetratricopeptide (TPR) repeat protein
MIILEEQCKSNPGFPPAGVLMAGLCFATKDVANGGRFLEQAAIDSPDHPGVYAAYGRIALGGNRNVDATVHFEKLLALLDQVELGKEAETHYENEYLDGMTQAASRLERYELARQLIAQSRQRKPDNIKPLQILAEIAFKQEKLDESLKHLRELKEMNPDTRAPESVIGSWFARAGELDKANEWMNRIPGKYADDANSLLEYASWSMSRESLGPAEDAIKTAESLKGPTPVSKGLKAKLAFVRQKFDDAVAGYQELHDSNPKNPDFANMLALSLVESGSTENKTKANQLATKNLQANPNNRIALAAAGYIRLQTLGVNPTIQGIFQKLAQTRDGRSPEVDYFLAKFLREAGQNQAAGQILQQGLNYKGLFLYRKQAEELLEKLVNSGLPTP